MGEADRTARSGEGGAPGFALTFVQGQGVLTIDDRSLGRLARLDRLELGVPGLRFPFDLSGGASRFRHRRCRLRELVVSTGTGEIERALREVALDGLRLSEPEVRLGRGVVEVGLRVEMGKRSVTVTARASAAVVAPCDLRVSVIGLRVHGFLPLPAPLLAAAVLGAMLGSGGRNGHGGAARLTVLPPLARLVGPTELELTALDLALFASVPALGWRLPERGGVKAEIVDGPQRQRFTVRFAADAADGDHRAGAGVHEQAEAALLSGDLAAALSYYRRAGAPSTGDAAAVERLLQLLVANPSTLDEADQVAAAALARWPGFSPALLTRAITAAERGRPEVAAALYDELASAADGSILSCTSARVAAAEQWAAAGAAATATERLEAVIDACPGHRGACRLLAARMRAEGRWQDLLRLLRQRAVDEVEAQTRAALHAEAGFVHLDHLGELERARDRFEQAVRVYEDEPSGWEGLGRCRAAAHDTAAARSALERALALYEGRADEPGQSRAHVALAQLDEAAGADEEALAHLESAAALDRDAFFPLRLAGELALRRSGADDAVRLLEQALGRATGPAQRIAVVGRLAEIHLRDRGDAMAARLLLEQALAETPSHLGLLERLGTLLEEQGAAGDWEPFLRRALGVSRDPDERRAVLGRLAALARRLEQRTLLREALAGLIAEAGPERAGAAAELAGLALAGDDASAWTEAAEALEAVLSSAAEPEGGRPELARRLAALRERSGDEEAALAWLRHCLEHGALGTVASAAWERFVAISARRGDAAAAAQALVAWADDQRTDEGERERAAHLVAAAEILRERLGMHADALALLERALALDPANDAAFLALEAATTALADWPRLADLLARRAEVARPVERRALLARLATTLEERLGQPERAAAIFAQLLELDPEDAEACLEVARAAWRQGDQRRAVGHYEALLAMPALRVTGGQRAEAHLRLGHWARVMGKMGEAARHLEAALAGEPETGAPTAVLVDELEACGRGEALVDVLARRAAAVPVGPERDALERASAGALERVGRSAEAEAIYEGLLARNGDDVDALRRVAEIHRREERRPELRRALARLWACAQRGADLDAEAVGVELAALLLEAPGGADEAEAVLRGVLAREATSRPALEALSALLHERGASAESDALLRRWVNVDPRPDGAIPLLCARARLRLEVPGGEEEALALLQAVPAERLPTDALSLRAGLAQRTGDGEDALASLLLLRSRGGDPEVTARLVAVATGPGLDTARAIQVLEDLLVSSPDDAAVAEALLDAYGRVPDPRVRHQAWAALLSREAVLPAASRRRVHAALAAAAAEDGDLQGALAHYDEALALDPEPAERADHLVGRARVLMARKQVGDALADVDEALTLAPEHAGALALQADVAYRAQEWEQARSTYARLAATSRAAEVVAPELLAFRRAELAEIFGDEDEAEAAYLEVAILNPRHLEARQALAQIALYRNDMPEAARRLDEVLRLLPFDAVEKLGEVRRKLGEVHAGLGQLALARHYLELALTDDAERVAALELLVGVYPRLELHREAAAASERLSRLYTEPRRRAEALFRQGEILRVSVGDEEAAGDAYLRSSDLDPEYEPTLVRLVFHYWRIADFASVAELGADLARRAPALVSGEEDLALVAALGTVMARREGAAALLAIRPPDAETAARQLGQLAQRLGRRSPATLDPALDLVLAETPDGFAQALRAALLRRVSEEATFGCAVALARLVDKLGDRTAARAGYALVLFLDPDYPAAARLGEIGPGVPARLAAWEPGAVDHPACAGPLRRALRALAPALAGLPELAADLLEAADVPVGADVAAVLAGLCRQLKAPACDPVLRGDGAELSVLATRPLTLEVGARVPDLPPQELVFLCARAVEIARSGTYALLASDYEQARALVPALLEAAGGTSDDNTGSGEGLAPALRWWLATPDTAALLPAGPERTALLGDLEQAAASPLDIEAYLRGCRFTADRVGLLACGSPLVALRVLLAHGRGLGPGGRTDPMLPVAGALRQEQLSSSPWLRELVRFLFSDEYRALVEERP